MLMFILLKETVNSFGLHDWSRYEILSMREKLIVILSHYKLTNYTSKADVVGFSVYGWLHLMYTSCVWVLLA